MAVEELAFQADARAKLLAGVEKLAAAVEKLWPAAKGSVREYNQKCVKAGCRRCASGKGHRVWQLTYYLGGRFFPRPRGCSSFYRPGDYRHQRHTVLQHGVNYRGRCGAGHYETA